MNDGRVNIDLGLKSLHVRLSGRMVGTLAQTADGVLAFEYADEWLQDGFSISPLSLPLQPGVFVAKPHPLDGVFGVFDDSLPDGWGRLLVDRMLIKRGVDPFAAGPLVRLAIVGKSGMGALEYEPETPLATTFGQRDFDEMAEECARLLKTNRTENLDELFAVGGSSGGARPKAMVEIDGEDWIVKFPSSVDPESIGAEEFAIAQAAQSCGIEMPPTRLLSSARCPGYFAVKRFDRVRDADGSVRKVHMASAGALLETTHRIPSLDYDLLMRLTLRLTGDASEVERLYRLMAFNAFIGNKDDHAKNFTFLYDEGNGRHDGHAEGDKGGGSWTLSPAYDLTRNAGMNGEHATLINGKGRDVTCDDVVAVGVRAGISKARAVALAREIEDVVRVSRGRRF